MVRNGLVETVCRQEGGARAYRDVFTARPETPFRTTPLNSDSTNEGVSNKADPFPRSSTMS